MTDTQTNDTDGGFAAADNTTYTAVFTLTQNGLNGEVFSSLRMDPEPDRENPAFAHVAMSELAQFFLFRAGIIDSEGELIVPTQEVEGGGLRVVSTRDATKH